MRTVALVIMLLAIVGCSATTGKTAAPSAPASTASVPTATAEDKFVASVLSTPGLSSTMSNADTIEIGKKICESIPTASRTEVVNTLGTSKLGPEVALVLVAAAETHLCPYAVYGSSSVGAAAPVTLDPVTPAPPATVPAAPSATTSQSNAVEKAESYLSYSAFSRTGLIKQLKYEEFSTADATYAVDHVTVDWTAQAAKKAKSYMEYSSFSRGGLIKQLKYEGFTQAQAEHGATSVGL